MTDADAFLRAIIENPNDDGPRLVYADWLEESGNPRGEFIRVQCEKARIPMPLGCQMLSTGHKPEWCDACRVMRREHALLFDNTKAFLEGLPGDWPAAHRHGIVNVTMYGAASYQFRSGFVEGIT